MACQSNLLGTRVDALRLDEAVHACLLAIDAARPVEIAVVNAAKIVKMADDVSLRQAVTRADIILADGQSVVLASRLLGQGLPQRVAGIDLFESLLRAAATRGLGVYLLGGTAAVVSRTAEEACRRNPGLQIVGFRDGYFDLDEEGGKVARAIAESDADLLFLGMTTPKKELFCGRHGLASGAKVIHGVGGSFDVMAGVVRRAPRMWQQLGLEWLYRMIQEPVRLGPRYATTNARFMAMTAVAWANGPRQLRSRSAPQLSPTDRVDRMPTQRSPLRDALAPACSTPAEEL